MAKRQVLRATQSPMNKQQWCLDLSCLHEVWVTTDGKKPMAKFFECKACDEERG